MDIFTAGGGRIKPFVHSLVFFLFPLAVLILGYFRCHFGDEQYSVFVARVAGKAAPVAARKGRG